MALDKETVDRLRGWYKNLKETNSGVWTFCRVQGRNYDLSPHTIYKIASGKFCYAWEKEGKDA